MSRRTIADAVRELRAKEWWPGEGTVSEHRWDAHHVDGDTCDDGENHALDECVCEDPPCTLWILLRLNADAKWSVLAEKDRSQYDEYVLETELEIPCDDDNSDDVASRLVDQMNELVEDFIVRLRDWNWSNREAG